MSDETLRALAEAATPGPWVAWIIPGCSVVRTAQEPYVTCSTDADLAFIAAANPTAVLALLDRLEAAEGALERVRALADEWARGCPSPAERHRLCKAGELHAALENGGRVIGTRYVRVAVSPAA